MKNRDARQYTGYKLSVIKFGGKGIGPNGKNIKTIIKRVNEIGKIDNHGPIVILSAPEGITDLAIRVGISHADPKIPKLDPSCLFSPYIKISERYMKGSHKDDFLAELKKCKDIVINTLKLVEPFNFIDRFRARILGYSGEILASSALSHVFCSQGIDSCNIPIDNWPIITDNNFENASFLRKESSRRLRFLLEPLEQKKVIFIGGFIGITADGIETTYERGGTDRTAVDLGILLKECFDVVVYFEKDDMVRSADPKIKGISRKELDRIHHLSYDEAMLAGQFGMRIVNPSAIRDILDSGLDIPLYVTDTNNPKRHTVIKKEELDEAGNPIKIVTGKKDCVILEMEKRKRDSLEDYLKYTKRYHDFLELSPYTKEGNSIARFLLLDGEFVRSNEKDIRAFDKNSTLEYGLGAITLVGNKMAKVPGIAGRAHSALEEKEINILDGFVQNPTSRVVIIVNENKLENSLSAIHSKRKY
ncbi:hypothetical protein AC481_05410 [miscellaneous Crenarchaeota group archaeon SMTZ-80]|nr:MAG: hypothetical protein AC481_05410 [miscellaneous Crenarchaeota group archaeon SMTZ-80]